MLISALAILVAVGVLAAVAASWLNRRRITSHRVARKVVRNRLLEVSTESSPYLLLQSIGVSPSEHVRGRRVLDTLMRTFDLVGTVPPANMALIDVLQVRVEEGQANSGSSEVVEPFTNDLVENLLTVVDHRLWKARLATDATFPATESALINLIETMTVASFVSFFAPLVREEKP